MSTLFFKTSPCITGLIAITLMSYNTVTKGKPLNLGLNISWVEERDADGKAIDMDIYFDRVVMICDKSTKKVITTGVLLDMQRILTSHNPFRKYVNEGKTQNIVVAILTGRKDNKTTHKYLQKIIYETTDCHQPVVNNALTDEQWHGVRKQHCPVHDLFVIKLKKKLTLIDPDPSKYHFSYITQSRYFTPVGPMITILAKRKDLLGHEIKFASLGFRNKDQIENGTVLRSYQYYEGNYLADCDEWFVRDWGRFICVQNDEDFLGIGSGSPLIYKNKLYGIGSFTLNKSNVSIFAFTDIRFYRKQIFNTCGKPSQHNGTTKAEKENYKYQYASSDDEDPTTTTAKSQFYLGRAGGGDFEWH